MTQSLSDIYRTCCRPELGKLLQVIRLDKTYHRAEGDFLFYDDEQGNTHKVLDLVGGYGASLFGHHHPELTRAAAEFFDRKRPFNAQGSCRASAGLVAQRLDELLKAACGRSFVTTFASTGAEAVEAAMKHAEFSLVKRLEDLKEQVEKACIRLRRAYRHGQLEIPDRFWRDVLEKFGVVKAAGLERALRAVEEFNRVAFSTPPFFVALEKSFHGKTTGSVQMTWNKDVRLPFTRIGARVLFIDPKAGEPLQDVQEKAELTWYFPEERDGKLVLSQKTLLNVSAIFVEPLQGEGGIHLIDEELFRNLRAFATRHAIPLVVDEIQSGMGRTGTFLFSQQLGVTGDYCLLSKSLGGGLAKISALCVARDLYEEEFSLLHTSTFAEDDFSAGIALRALDLLAPDDSGDSPLMRQCREKGRRVMEGLKKLMSEFPEVIRDVRGRGLMIGVEFQDLSDIDAYGIRGVAAGKILGFVVAGYFLHEHDIRVAPAVSSNRVMRIEPSAFIADASIDAFLAALARLCQIISRNNSGELMKFLAGAPPTGLTGEIRDYRKPRRICPPHGPVKKVAVIGHLVSSDHLALWDNSFEILTPAQRKVFVDRVFETMRPFVCNPWLVRSPNGDQVEVSVVALLIDSDLFYRNMIRQLQVFRDKVHEAVELAEEKGFSTVCLGGYTSMVTRNGETLETDRIVVTTGNALTVGMGLEAIYQTAAKQGIVLSEAIVAVVGAAGNIGSAYAEIIAEKAGKLVLIGRRGRDETLRKSASHLYHSLIRTISGNAPAPGAPPATPAAPRGIPGRIAASATFRGFQAGVVQPDDLFDAFDREFGDDAPITIGRDLTAMRSAQIILTASNSSEPIIRPEFIGDHPVIINDVSVPADTHPSVREQKKNAVVIKGGIVRLPRDPDLRIDGLDLEPGTLYACISEAILLAFEGVGEHFSYGRIEPAQVNRIMEIARRHGFTLGGAMSEGWT